jgi:biopolymer transport protein ExbB/TolQ
MIANMSSMIYVTLGILYCGSLHAIVYRLMHIDRRLRLCPPSVLHALISLQTASQILTQFSKPKKSLHLGWLCECSNSFTSRRSAAARIDELRREQESQISVLHLVSTLAPTLGLLGTVLGFLSQRIDSTTLGHAFATTALGVVISILPTVYLSLTQATRDRLQDQMAVVLQHLSQMQEAPTTLQEERLSDEKATLNSTCLARFKTGSTTIVEQIHA